ncbi:WD40 repeat domain-containing protein [Actinomadura sp. ATCC 31491]|uniref:WD40 repeat domain-containing protein n=1 Tax=Actinomadura luzonensis TaxID=2805427 RepID=A0ABT0G6G6_9ACTN|nr:WD40 repeat domain-containing protein [Actinomadura luzonensis]
MLEAFRYVVSGDDPVRLLRPALPMAWPRLRLWISANREGLAVHRRISSAAGRWQEHGRRDADLFHGSTLDAALRWAAADRRNITLTPAERDFLEAGAALTRRRQRRTRLMAGALAVLLVVAVVAGLLAVRQSATLAEQGATLAGQRDAADSARLAAAAETVRGRDPVLGMLLSAAAGRLSPTAEARSSLLASAVDPAEAAFHDPGTGPGVLRALSADGRTLVSVSPDQVRIWDVGAGRRTGGFALDLAGRGLRGIALSADGKLLAVLDRRGAGVWETATGRPAGRRLAVSAEVEGGVAFSADRLLVTEGQGLTVWDWRTGRRTALATMEATAVHPGADYAVSGARRWALPSGREERGFPGVCADCAGVPAFSPDGRLLALAGHDGLTVFDARTRKEVTAFPDWETGARPVFSPDGRLLAGSGDRVRVYRLDADEPLLLDRPVSDPVDTVALAGERLRYLSEDTVVTLRLNLAGEDRMDDVRLTSGGTLATHEVGADRVVVGGHPLRIGRSDPYDVELSLAADGRRTAVRRGTGSVDVYDVATGRRLAHVRPRWAGAFEENAARLSPAGLWTAGEDAFTLWRVPGGERVTQVARPALLGWTVTAGGRLVGLDAGRLRLVDLRTGQPFGARLPFPAEPGAVWFSGDARQVAAEFTGKIGLWDTSTGRQLGGWLRMGAFASWDGRFSADGRLFAFASQDKTLSLWDVATGERIGPVIGLGDSARSVVFSPDGGEVSAVGRAGRVTRVPTAVGPLLKAVCARAGRSLTAAEWARHLPGRPYRKGC